MRGDVILGKTRRGLDELVHRTGTLSQKQRSVLILVDGKTCCADLAQKCAFIPEYGEHLDWLLQNGFVESLGTSPAAAPDDEVANLPPAAGTPAVESPKKALIAMAQTLLGPHAGTVVKRLQDTEDTHDALVQALDRGYKLIRLSIDEKKAEQFRKMGAALMAGDAPTR